jgi:hypothetical protein
MAHRKRQFHATACNGGLFAVAKIEVALPHVHIGMAYAAGCHLDEYFGALWFRVGVLPHFQRFSVLDDLAAAHIQAPNFSGSY